MKNLFPGYYRKSESELKVFWKTGIICFDANVILNLYRYSDETRKTFLDLIYKFKDKIWLPHQAALEYNKNRYEVINEQEKAYKDFREKISQIQIDLKSNSKPPFITEKVHTTLNKILEQVDNEVLESLEKCCNLLKEDPIYIKLSDLFENKISDAFSEDKLQEIYKEGIKRYENKIPPGYADGKDKQGDNKFGDLVIWKQIMEKAKQENKPIILITDERKTDWWWKLKDGRIIGPRQELIEEIKNEANTEFHMYSSENFISHGLKYLNEAINNKAIEEIQEISRSNINEIINKNKWFRILGKINNQKIDEINIIDSMINELKNKIENHSNVLNLLDLNEKEKNVFTNEINNLRSELEKLNAKRQMIIESSFIQEYNKNSLNKYNELNYYSKLGDDQ